MNIKLIAEEKITISELKEIAQEFYITMIKGAVDIEKGIVVFGGEYHIDASAFLTEKTGSKSDDIWGFNIYLDQPKEEWIEYRALINIKPVHGNRSMIISDKKIRDRIQTLVNSKIE
ncbi:MAG: DUF5674 family protein [Patescibacteria group bacterium]